MERTLTLETRALKAASRQWKELSPEMQRMISMWTLFAHRTAPLIKDLEFTRLPETDNGVYRPVRLQVRAAPHARFRKFLWQTGTAYFGLASSPEYLRPVPSRFYQLSDFGDSEYDRYQIDSDQQSGITLGRVAGTERWGHHDQ